MSDATASTAAGLNRLGREPSPYLLQHARDPVDWQPWGEPAFAEARRLNRPIFLSIGYSTCHWCHVMHRESFADPALGRLLNEHFISIKVDREERPDVDRIYMSFVQSITGRGGWPLTVFLTPELKPFYGGTYFPPSPRHGQPGLPQVLTRVAELWRTRPDELRRSAESAVGQLGELADLASAPVDAGTAALDRASAILKESFDPEHGGFGGAPKFPQPSLPALLLRQARRCRDDEARRMALETCDQMAAGGIHDQLGGGFARYAVDAAWRVPHFEKMLYDNAQLAALYLDAFRVSGEARHAAVARDVLDYVLRDLTHPEGGFYSAEDADSEGQEGKFYCWTRAEFSQLLSPEEFNVAGRHFGVTADGNFLDHSHPDPLPNLNVLHVAEPLASEADQPLLDAARAKLLAARNRRVRPHRDEKILASWNGLMLSALARAYAVLGDEAYRVAAERNLAFLQRHLWEPPDGRSPGTLHHRWCDGERDSVQILSAYACLAAGALDLYETTLAPAHLDFALALAESLVARFEDAARGGFWQSQPAPDLILRFKDDHDGAEPSGNAVATLTLLRLAAITGRADLRAAAERALRGFGERIERFPHALPALLQAVEFSLQEPRRVVIAGEPDQPPTRALLHAAHSVFQPNQVVLGTAGAVEPSARTLRADNGPRAFVCTGTACQPPTGDPAALRELLR